MRRACSSGSVFAAFEFSEPTQKCEGCPNPSGPGHFKGGLDEAQRQDFNAVI
jgi:hypothetical protein